MPTSEWTPSVDQVGAILRTRTKVRAGSEVGTFTDETRPTAQQVDELIRSAVNDVADVIGADVPLDRVTRAADVAAIGAALLVELTFFPEQVATGRSPYDNLKALYDERLERLRLADESEESGGEPGRPPQPVALYSSRCPDLIGRATRW